MKQITDKSADNGSKGREGKGCKIVHHLLHIKPSDPHTLPGPGSMVIPGLNLEFSADDLVVKSCHPPGHVNIFKPP